MASAYRPTGEDALVSVKPALRSVLLRSATTGGVCAVLAAAMYWGLPALGAGDWRNRAMLLLLAVVIFRVLWECAVWASRSYVLTAERVISISGVLRRQIRDLPVERIQNVVLDRTLAERLFGLGTIGVASAGSAWIDVAWVMIARSPARLQRIRDVVAHKESDDEGESTALRLSRREPPVIGIAGGIGSGKTAVARELEELGCVVVDSDAVAKRILDQPDVLNQLRDWWGDEVVAESGKADRARIASIVFGDSEQRARLESLIHPRVKAARSKTIAQSGDARAIVIDAPLLFEAGVHEECDLVIFVDAPEATRLERVRERRGWDEDELARREASQWSLDRKRAASDVTIENDTTPEDLSIRVRRALVSLEDRLGDMHKNPGSSG